MTSAHAARAVLVAAVLGSGSVGVACSSPVAVDLADDEGEALRRWLAESGIASDQVPTANGRSQIRVPSLDADRALARLGERGRRAPENTSALPLVPSRAQAELDADRARASDVEAAIERVPGVLRAKLVLGPPPRMSTLPSGEPVRRSAAVVVTRRPASTFDAKSIRIIVASGVGGVSADGVEVIDAEAAPSAAPPALARWGPVSVPETALPTLRLWFGGSAFLNLVTLGAVLYFRKRAAAGIQRA